MLYTSFHVSVDVMGSLMRKGIDGINVCPSFVGLSRFMFGVAPILTAVDDDEQTIFFLFLFFFSFQIPL